MNTFLECDTGSSQSIANINDFLITATKSKTLLHYYKQGKESPHLKSTTLERLSSILSYDNYIIGGSIQGSIYIWEISYGTMVSTWKPHFQ
mmetsp:Transcript_31346/g.5648  ORF Transcript_31346/g.5648 Transcript_31346/m.5648 type:complete len:91 (+) Transcript_31346:75-347(+)